MDRRDVCGHGGGVDEDMLVESGERFVSAGTRSWRIGWDIPRLAGGHVGSIAGIAIGSQCAGGEVVEDEVRPSSPRSSDTLVGSCRLASNFRVPDIAFRRFSPATTIPTSSPTVPPSLVHDRYLTSCSGIVPVSRHHHFEHQTAADAQSLAR